MTSEDRKKHIYGVAELMKQYAIENNLGQRKAEEYYVLGLLHDIGYEFLEPKDYEALHEKCGGGLLKAQGYKYWKEVYYHGKANCKYRSKALDVLNWADMHIDSVGKYVSLDGRLEELSTRYNVPIDELNSKPIVDELKARGFD